ncbi:secretin N-terminal domain-containing protein [Limnohabitans sp.]|uniref:secretin N-terminal domain-containing protein n=1 Tax=Limnohabitans sp. TaxID=1907725 RepID=UPI0038B998F2
MSNLKTPGKDLRGGRVWLLTVMLVLSLAGCAGHSEFLEGKRLLQENKIAEGLTQMEQAIRKNPSSNEFKVTYASAKDRAIQGLLRHAERMLRAQRLDVAEQTYKQVLSIDAENDMAVQGMTQVQTQRGLSQKLQSLRTAKLAGDWKQMLAVAQSMLAQQSDHLEALSAQQEAQTQLTPAPVEDVLGGAFRKPASLEFRDAPLRQIFDALSLSSNLNFIFDKELNKPDLKASITLREGTVETALTLLLAANQLDMQVVNANTVLIFPATAAKQKDYQELTVRMFPMMHADAKFVAAAIKTLFKGREPVVDDKLNLLVVRDTPSAIKVIEKLVRLYDVPDAEVMLELEILEVSRTKLLQLGVGWPENLTLSPLTESGGTNLTLNGLRRLNGDTTGVQIGNLALNLSEQNDLVNVLANPRIRVINKEKAKVLIGDRVPVVTVTTSPTGGFAESVTYVDVGLKLDVEPVIYRGSDIAIKVSMEVSTISGSTTTKLGTVAYSFGTRSANTTLRLKDGETQVLAGLISDEDRDSAKKIPALGDLPMFGKLFGTSRDQSKKTEIILSITPRLVRNQVARGSADLEFLSGPESRIKQGAGAASSGSDAGSAAPAASNPPKPAAMPVAPPGVPVGTPTGVPPGLAPVAPATTSEEGKGNAP